MSHAKFNRTGVLRNNPLKSKHKMAKIVEGLHYSESHEYVKIEKDCAIIGITDFAQEQLGNVVYVDVPEVGEEVTAGETFGAVESTKAASDLISPVTGEVIEVNEALEDEPELVNRDAFGKGWIIKVKLASPEEIENLLDAKSYEGICHE